MKKVIVLGSIACLLCTVSILLASQANLFYENLTYIGNLANTRLYFMLWGIALSLFYAYSYYTLYNVIPYAKHKYVPYSILCCVVSIIAFVLPYQNHSGDLLSQLHVYGSMASCIATYIIVAFTLFDASLVERKQTHRIQTLFYAILFISVASILFIGDISSFGELLLLNGLSLVFVYAIYQYKKN